MLTGKRLLIGIGALALLWFLLYKPVDRPIVQQAQSTVTGANRMPEQKPNLPSFTLLKDESYEAPGTAKVLWQIVLTTEVDQSSLTALLTDLYIQAQAVKFSHQGSPTVIDIKAYMSPEHATSQWIGWLGKNASESTPKLSFDDRQLANMGELPEDRFGLSEPERREIWLAIVGAEERTRREAERVHPEPSPFTRDAYQAAYNARETLNTQLREQAFTELRDQYELTQEQFDGIKREGFEKSWAFPARQ